MGLKEWKDKYYPIPAKKVPLEQALDHSIQKWEGLQLNVLKEYELKQVRYHICGIGGTTTINGDTCALCFHHTQLEDDIDCSTCPLAISRNGYPCDERMPNEEISPYHAFTEHENAKPMLDALKLAKRMQENQNES